MSLSPSLHSYGAELSAFERANNAEKGIRINFPLKASARHFMNRLHYARALMRKENTKVFKEGDPGYGHSEYDGLTCSLKEDDAGEWWIYIQKNETVPGEIEEIQ